MPVILAVGRLRKTAKNPRQQEQQNEGGIWSSIRSLSVIHPTLIIRKKLNKLNINNCFVTSIRELSSQGWCPQTWRDRKQIKGITTYQSKNLCSYHVGVRKLTL
jgi:hypothetical protein